MLVSLIKKYIPEKIKKKYRKKEQERIAARKNKLPLLSVEEFSSIVTNELGIVKGDTVFIHSSLDGLNPEFPSYKILNILLDIVGEEGTLLFPAYPKVNSYSFLKSGEIFNIKKSPAYTGLLNEFARRHKKAVRSLHPTKSVVAIGINAADLTSTHSDSPYPYDINSPYYKISEYKGKIIGIGVKTTYLSCVHCIDDIMRGTFPVDPYHKELFHARCIDYDGEEKNVKTYAHKMSKMNLDLPRYFKDYIPGEVCRDIEIKGMNFFRADAGSMFEHMRELAEKKITIYKRYHYKIKYML